MRIKKGLWYLCDRTFNHWRKGYYYYAPDNGLLNGHDNRRHEISDYLAKKYFTKEDEIRVAEP